MIFDPILALFSRDLAIDLGGTANSLVYIKRAGVVLREPSVVAIRKDSGSLLQAGEEANRMVGEDPGGQY